jgi:hypothetical protein
MYNSVGDEGGKVVEPGVFEVPSLTFILIPSLYLLSHKGGKLVMK